MANSLVAVLGIGGSGGSAIPIGSMVQFSPAAKGNFVTCGQEFLRAGYVKPYNLTYASSCTSNPELRVYGDLVNTYTVPAYCRAHFLTANSRYVYTAYGDPVARYNTSMLLPAHTECTGFFTPMSKASCCTTTYIVVPRDGNLPLQYTADGAAWASVGGTWTSTPLKTAINYFNNKWLAISSLKGEAKEIAYIDAASPAGAWSMAMANASVYQTVTDSIAYGAALWCAVGTGVNWTNGAIATSPDGLTWTDRSPMCGLVGGVKVGSNLMWTGQKFIARFDGKWATSTNGTYWTWLTDTINTGAAYTAGACDNGNGRVLLVGPNGMGIISPDHGATWIPLQTSMVATEVGYTNNIPWVTNWTSKTFVAFSDPVLNPPEYVGMVPSDTALRHVRIK